MKTAHNGLIRFLDQDDLTPISIVKHDTPHPLQQTSKGASVGLLILATLAILTIEAVIACAVVFFEGSLFVRILALAVPALLGAVIIAGIYQQIGRK